MGWLVDWPWFSSKGKIAVGVAINEVGRRECYIFVLFRFRECETVASRDVSRFRIEKAS